MYSNNRWRQARRMHEFLGISLDLEKTASLVDELLYRNRR
jgi:hypothetical protein